MSIKTIRYEHSIRLSKDRWHELGRMKEWCYQNIGNDTFNENWGYATAFNNITFWFKRSEDVMQFALRWL